MVICLERGADFYMAQLMPLPLTVSCSSKIQIGFTFLVPADLGSPGQSAVKRARACVRYIPKRFSGNARRISSDDLFIFRVGHYISFHFCFVHKTFLLGVFLANYH